MRLEHRFRSMSVVTFMAVVTLTSNGQPVIRTPGCPSSPAWRPGVSPYEIVQGRPPLKDLWSTLGIPAKLRFSSERGFASGSEEIDCTTGCKATILSYDQLLVEDGDDAVVRVCTEYEAACRFLVLHQGSTGWSLVGYVDSPFEQYEAPTAWVEAAQDRRWLVRRGFGGGGTGVYLAVADWFEIRCGELQRVLTLPSKGHDVNARPARFFSTRFKSLHKQGERESLEFGYVVLFQDDDRGELWQEERTVVFSRSDSNRAFVFDPVASGISAAFKDKVFAFDSMDQSDFIEFAYDRLLRVARDPADHRRDWLRRFLNEIPATAKVKTLKALLDTQQRPPQSRKQEP